jgi:hypothetical protein
LLGLKRYPWLTFFLIYRLSIRYYFLHTHLAYQSFFLVLSKRKMVVSSVLLRASKKITALGFISEGVSLIAPLGSILMFFLLLLQLPRKIKMAPMLLSINLSRLWVSCGLRILFIFHNNVHFLRLYNVLLDDVIGCIIVIY